MMHVSGHSSMKQLQEYLEETWLFWIMIVLGSPLIGFIWVPVGTQLLAMLLLYFVLGTALDGLGMLILSLPFVMPLMATAGHNGPIEVDRKSTRLNSSH